MRGLKRSSHSCHRQVNVGYKNIPSMHHPQRRNVTASMVGLKKKKNGKKDLTKNDEPQRYNSERRSRRRNVRKGQEVRKNNNNK